MEINDFENYLIFSDGRVWSKRKPGINKFLKLCLNNKGFYFVCLSKNGRPTPKTIHRLLATHYIQNPENKPTVIHIDRNKLNNDLSNLKWATYSENQFNKDAYGQVKYKGVYIRNKMYRCSITIKGQTKYIGSYKTSEEAHNARNVFINNISYNINE